MPEILNQTLGLADDSVNDQAFQRLELKADISFFESELRLNLPYIVKAILYDKDRRNTTHDPIVFWDNGNGWLAQRSLKGDDYDDYLGAFPSQRIQPNGQKIHQVSLKLSARVNSSRSGVALDLKPRFRQAQSDEEGPRRLELEPYAVMRIIPEISSSTVLVEAENGISFTVLAS